MKAKLILVFLALLVPVFFACRHPIETDPQQSPEITGLQIVPSAVCGSAEVTFTLTDPNEDEISWEAKMNTSAFGDVDQQSGTDVSGTTVQTRFKAANTTPHRHRVTLTVTARDDAGNEAQPAVIDFSIFYPC